MRSGDTQSTPTATPDVRVFIGSDEYRSHGAGGSERLVSFTLDEQVWGGSYEIILDNSDGALSSKDYNGSSVDVRLGFSSGSHSLFPHLWVFKQMMYSARGKLLMKLTCIDGWGMLAQCKLTLGNAYFNQEWQKDENIDEYTLPSGDPIPVDLRAELVANSNLQIQTILTNSILNPFGFDIIGWGDGSDLSLANKPPISIPNPISGVRQLLEMTKSYLIWWRCTAGGGDFSNYKMIHDPPAQASVFSYSSANTFFVNTEEAGLVIPNRILYWAFNEDGTDWIHGQADDTDSQQKIIAGTPLGMYPGEPEVDGILARHYILTPEMQVDGRSTEAALESMAEGTLGKVRQERSQGFLIAPMHCSQELFDNITVVDSRYSPSRTVTGIVHRIVREYDRGKYQITLYLGGVTSGVTSELGGNYAVPLHEAEPPRAPVLSGAGAGLDCLWQVQCNTASLRPSRATYLQIPVGIDMYHS